jgi:hypothetical protein
VVLTLGARRDSAMVEVRPNPAGHATAADLRAQFELLSAIRDRLSETHVAVMTIRDVRAQTKELGERAERLGKGGDLSARAKTLGDKLTAVENQLTNPNIKGLEDDLNYRPALDHDLTFLAGVVGGADRRPTDGSMRIYDDLQRQLAGIQAQLKGILDTDLAEFNRAVQAAGIPPVVASPKINP